MSNNKLTLSRIFIVLGLIIVAIPGIIAMGTYSTIRSHLESEMDRTNEAFAMMLSKQAVMYLHRPLEDLQRAVRPLETMNVTRSEDILAQLTILKSHEHFSHFQVVDQNGIIQFNYPENQESVGTDLSGMKAFTVPIHTQKVYWGGSFISAKTNMPMTTISIPCGKGIIVAYLKLEGLSNLIKPAVKGDESLFAITDQNGVFVAHTNPKSVNERRLCPLHPQVGNLVQGEIKRFPLSRPDGEYYCYFSPAGIPGWNVISCQRISVIYAPARTIMNIFIAIGMLTAFISFCTLFPLAKHFFRTVSTFVDSITTIADGNYTTLVPAQKLAEFDTLAQSVNSMTAHIQKREIQLQDKNDQLKTEMHSKEVLEKKNRDFQEYLDTLIESMPSAIIAVNEDGTLRHFNSKSFAIIDIEPSPAPKHLTDLVPESLCNQDDLKQALSTQNAYVKTKRPVLIKNETRYFNTTIFPLSYGGGNVAVIKVDTVTDQVQMERMMVQAEKMSSVAGLAAGMAHEINNPLAAITQGFQNILRRLDPQIQKNIEAAQAHGLDLNELHSFLKARRIIDFLEGGRDSVSRAAQIVRNMLQFSRRSDSAMAMTDIAELVETTINLGASDYNMKKKYDLKFMDIVKEFDPDLPRVMCSPSEIEQVLLNLLKNAMHAMEEVERDEHKPQIIIRLVKEEEFARIEVEDNGPGIPPDVQTRIFEPFFTTKPTGTGTGLGLSVSYMIVTQNHGGTFECVTELGKGTNFIIRLPYTSTNNPNLDTRVKK